MLHEADRTSRQTDVAAAMFPESVVYHTELPDPQEKMNKTAIKDHF